ncbi:hypothetical protein OIU84_025141 [Salix udensis]|uniref:Uncharacterized protein n=1 Tax=Salix udensis TaxID=889485 RepID=A0AAD6KJC6_9ROSI|nr:hypothetical protein OIU84_025141 [Salix udensis]
MRQLLSLTQRVQKTQHLKHLPAALLVHQRLHCILGGSTFWTWSLAANQLNQRNLGIKVGLSAACLQEHKQLHLGIF